MITQSKHNIDTIREVEEAALDRIRTKHECETKETKIKGKKGNPEVELDSDHEADWMEV